MSEIKGKAAFIAFIDKLSGPVLDLFFKFLIISSISVGLQGLSWIEELGEGPMGKLAASAEDGTLMLLCKLGPTFTK